MKTVDHEIFLITYLRMDISVCTVIVYVDGGQVIEGLEYQRFRTENAT